MEAHKGAEIQQCLRGVVRGGLPLIGDIWRKGDAHEFDLRTRNSALNLRRFDMKHILLTSVSNHCTGASEQGSLQFRRSLYCIADIKRGEKFTPENVRAIRPGFGLPPGRIGDVIGKRAACDVARGTPLSDQHLHF